VGFILLVSGFVVYEILSEWPASKAILTWVPNQLAVALGITGSLTGFVSAIVMFIMFPAALFLVVTALAKVASGGRVTDTALALPKKRETTEPWLANSRSIWGS
jgi:hypothetical protein